MRTQKKFTFLSILSIGLMALFLTFTFSSCKEDHCKATVCAYEGICNDDGSCTCLVGYEGERCETISRDKFKGAWTITEKGSISNTANYASTIQNGNAIDEVVIHNFNNKFNSIVNAKIVNDTMYIPSQTMISGDEEYTVSGKGYVIPEEFYGLHGKMVLQYKVISSDQSVNNYGSDGKDNPSIWTK